MSRIAFKIVLTIWIATCANCSAAPIAASPLIGDYEFYSGTDPRDVYLSVSVVRDGGKYSLGLMAAHPDAHGAAPDGGGAGRIGADGVLRFEFEDSFSNRGSGTFRRARGGYGLSIHIDEVHESRCLPFYGTHVLRRVKGNNARSRTK